MTKKRGNLQLHMRRGTVPPKPPQKHKGLGTQAKLLNLKPINHFFQRMGNRQGAVTPCEARGNTLPKASGGELQVVTKPVEESEPKVEQQPIEPTPAIPIAKDKPPVLPPVSEGKTKKVSGQFHLETMLNNFAKPKDKVKRIKSTRPKPKRITSKTKRPKPLPSTLPATLPVSEIVQTEPKQPNPNQNQIIRTSTDINPIDCANEMLLVIKKLGKPFRLFDKQNFCFIFDSVCTQYQSRWLQDMGVVHPGLTVFDIMETYNCTRLMTLLESGAGINKLWKQSSWPLQRNCKEHRFEMLGVSSPFSPPTCFPLGLKNPSLKSNLMNTNRKPKTGSKTKRPRSGVRALARVVALALVKVRDPVFHCCLLFPVNVEQLLLDKEWLHSWFQNPENLFIESLKKQLFRKNIYSFESFKCCLRESYEANKALRNAETSLSVAKARETYLKYVQCLNARNP